MKERPIIFSRQFNLPVEAFADIWNSINAKRGYSWESNPWVWVVEFKRKGDQ
jgi:hypothetical protein